MMEGMSGVGLVSGLLGGSIIYETMGYQAVFIYFGSLLPILAIVSRLLFRCLEMREIEQAQQREQDAFLNN
jgi:hypothetical protein